MAFSTLNITALTAFIASIYSYLPHVMAGSRHLLGGREVAAHHLMRRIKLVSEM